MRGRLPPLKPPSDRSGSFGRTERTYFYTAIAGSFSSHRTPFIHGNTIWSVSSTSAKSTDIANIVGHGDFPQQFLVFRAFARTLAFFDPVLALAIFFVAAANCCHNIFIRRLPVLVAVDGGLVDHHFCRCNSCLADIVGHRVDRRDIRLARPRPER